MIGDLHCHTTLSDGSMSVEDLIAYAHAKGLSHIAITDHDTMAGVEKASVLAKDYNLTVLPGVELSTQDNTRNGRMVHILCYFPQDLTPIEKICNETTESRTYYTGEMLKKVMALYPLTQAHAHRHAKESVSFYKVHIMRALMDLGFTDRIYGELYRELFSSKTGSCFLKHAYPDVRMVIETVRKAGGIAVLAHPQAYDSMDLFFELAKEQAIDGVEGYHPKNTPEGTDIIVRTAKKNGLIVTGGTDFHGMYTTKPHTLGSFVTQKESLEQLFRLHEQRKMQQ